MTKQDYNKPKRNLWQSKIDKMGNIKPNFDGMKTLKTFESFNADSSDEINETYYNKEWTVTNIEQWIKEYAQEKKMELQTVEKKKFGSNKTVTSYKMGDYVVFMVDEKSPGAPRLADILVVIGDPGNNNFHAKNTKTISDHTGSRSQMFNMFDEKIKGK